VVSSIAAIKVAVTETAANNINEFKRHLDAGLYKEAHESVSQIAFLDQVLELDAFSQTEGRVTDYREKLRSHCGEWERIADETRKDTQKDGSKAASVAQPILRLGRLRIQCPMSREYANASINKVLLACERDYGAAGMNNLASALRGSAGDNGVIGAKIVSDSPSFKAMIIKELNNKTKKDLVSVKKAFGIADEDVIWRRYDEFRYQYKQDYESCVNFGGAADPLQLLVAEARSRVGGAQPNSLTQPRTQQNLPKILAAVFAWWTVEFYLDQENRRNQGTSSQSRANPDVAGLRMANHAQVICIMRLLGISSTRQVLGFTTDLGYSVDNSSLQNHLAQVLTGEGKSVVIAVTAVVLALFGFNVDCVCYSSMLSERDKAAFASMLEAFGVSSQIQYGTFDSQYESLLREVHGDLRAQCMDHLRGAASSRQGQLAALPPRVLFVDEVDVFLTKSFFGSTLQMSFCLQNKEIVELLTYIWSQRSRRSNISAIKSHPTYKAVLESGIIHRSHEWFLEVATQKMLNTCAEYKHENWDYIVRDGSVCYKVEGRTDYSANWVYDFETTCTYLHESLVLKNIPQSSLESKIGLYGRFGQFSFAMITSKVHGLPPFYRHVLGVSGTLEEAKLPPKAHAVLKDEVGIKRYTYCPTMYGELKRNFKETRGQDVQVLSNEAEHFGAIADEIKKRLLPIGNMEGKRAVIAFFEDKATIMRFYESEYFESFRADRSAKLLFEAADYIDSIIEGATVQGAITLATRSYGRGTDFRVFDTRMLACGGVHVLLTFYPKEISELEQVKGRGARQGDDGSFSMVMSIPQIIACLGDCNVKAEQITQWAAGSGEKETIVFEELGKIRDKIATRDMQDLRKEAVTKKAEHNRCAAALLRYQRGENTQGLKELVQQYNGWRHAKVAVMFVIDVSFSMDETDPMRETLLQPNQKHAIDTLQGRLSAVGAELGALTFSLMWDNTDDLDLYVQTTTGDVISYENRTSRCGGQLDVDMNAGQPKSSTPVENCYWIQAPPGQYTFWAHNVNGRPVNFWIREKHKGTVVMHQGCTDQAGAVSAKFTMMYRDPLQVSSNTRLHTATKCICGIIQDHLKGHDEVGLTTFATDVKTDIRLQQKAGQEDQMLRMVKNMRTRGKTQCYGAIRMAAEQLQAGAPSDVPKWVVALTDGKDTESRSDDVRGAARLFKEAKDLNFAMISLGSEVDVNAVRSIQQGAIDGGNKGLLVSAQSMKEVEEAFGNIADELMKPAAA